MIKSIRLLNWRSHADTKLEFSEGANLLIGQMGAGKSSVMDAISFALFGTFPALDRRKLKLADLFRMNEVASSVSLEFGLNGSVFRIERRLGKGKAKVESEAELFRDGSMLESGPSAVTDYISNALGVDYGLFTRAIYSEQNNIDYFLTIDPHKRKAELDMLLGLDRFEAARGNIVSVINRIKSDRKLLEERFRPEALEGARVRSAELEANLASLRDGAAKLSALAEQQKKALGVVDAGLSEARKRKELHEALSRDRLRQETLSSALRAELAGKTVDAAALEAAKAGLAGKKKLWESLKLEINRLDSGLSALSKSAGSLEARLKRAEQALVELEKAGKELHALLGNESHAQAESRKAELEKEVISLLSEQRALSAGIRETEELVLRLKPGLAKCPLCDNDLGEEGTTHVIEEKNRKTAEQKQLLKDAEAKAHARRKLLDELALRLKKASSIADSISLLEKEAAAKPEAERSQKEILDRIAAEASRRAGLEEKSNALSPEIQSLAIELNQMEDLLKKQGMLLEAERKLSDCAAKLSGLAFDSEAFEAQLKLVEEARIALQKTSGDEASLAKEVLLVSQMHEQVKEGLAQAEAASRDVSRYAALEEQLSLYHRALIETQASLRANLADDINSAMREVWSIFYPYKNYPSIRLLATEKDYMFEVLDREVWKPLESVASGGERACAALALRVALAAVLTPNLSWLVLDEPTHNLDAEAVRLLSDTLQTRVPEVVKQTFVITHEEGLMGADFASAYRLSRDGSGTGPTKAERI